MFRIRHLFPMVTLYIAGAIGAFVTVLSSYIGERPATARYSDIDGCVVSCQVVSSGWPLSYVVDYPGMTMIGVATIDEVLFAGDRFEVLPFVADLAFWTILTFLTLSGVNRLRRLAA